MNLNEEVERITMDYGIFGTYLIGTELWNFGELPLIPDGYSLYKVNSDKDVEIVRDIMKVRNLKIDKLYPNSKNEVNLELNDYESRCFFTMLFFENVFNFWCGKNTEVKYDQHNKSDLANFDLFSFDLWAWVRGEISTKKLKQSSLDFEKAVTK